MKNFLRSPKSRQSGSALIYILIAIALLAALTVTFMQPSSQQTSSQNSFKSLAEIENQINLIRSAIQECVLYYPKGDKCINGFPAPGSANDHCTTSANTDPGARENYPINPDSLHYTNATPGRSGDQLVRNLRCPGNNPGDNADHDNHGTLFAANSGKFLPPAPDLFEDWQYYNGTDGVFFWTRTDKTDAFIRSSLEKLDEKLPECEADIIDTSDAPPGAKNLDSGPTYTCPAGNICFRVWMIQNGSAVFNGDADGDEAGC